jgi:hypothetical protein
MRRALVPWLVALAAGCASGAGGEGVTYLPPPKDFQPFSAPPPVDTWAAACEVRCPDGSTATATARIRGWRGEPPRQDRCERLGRDEWTEACGKPTAGECLRCAAWETAPQ